MQKTFEVEVRPELATKEMLTFSVMFTVRRKSFTLDNAHWILKNLSEEAQKIASCLNSLEDEDA